MPCIGQVDIPRVVALYLHFTVIFLVWGRSLPIVRYLVEDMGFDIELQSKAGCNVAIWAAASGDLELCQWLYRVGANFTVNAAICLFYAVSERGKAGAEFMGSRDSSQSCLARPSGGGLLALDLAGGER